MRLVRFAAEDARPIEAQQMLAIVIEGGGLEILAA
jgi:hypothetical protein